MAAALPATDTISAIATAPGAGGIGIVRISGPGAEAILNELFRPRDPLAPLVSHRLRYGILSGRDGKVIDEVLAVLMRAPNSYTREDVVEIHSHGSSLVLHAILEQVLACGARVAEPGEFTKRAFLAGRIDLTRAEAVADLIQARTQASARLAAEQMRGSLFSRIEVIRQALIELLAIVEVAIDFPDEDEDILHASAMLLKLEEEIADPLAEMLDRAEQGRVLREGLRVVIAGRPNVGKSSLLNALLQEERALVTEEPGTTRDTVEEWINVHGIPVHLVDTAGIREHANPVEGMGIERARRKVAEADLVLIMVDGNAGLTGEDEALYAAMQRQQHLVLINKSDIAPREKIDALRIRFNNALVIAARDSTGLDALLSAIRKVALGDEQGLYERMDCAPNIRHRAALLRASDGVQRVRVALQQGLAADLLAVELQTVLDHLGDIVGLTTPDDVLDTIFSRFCLGK